MNNNDLWILAGTLADRALSTIDTNYHFLDPEAEEQERDDLWDRLRGEFAEELGAK